jgi:hypothetical protein
LTVLEQSKAMGIRGAAWSALVRSNSVSTPFGDIKNAML